MGRCVREARVPDACEDTSMEDSVNDTPDLPTGYCTSCRKDVIAHARLGHAAREGALVWLCIFCDTELVDEGGGPVYVTPDTLKDMGYRVGPPDEVHAVKGCSSGRCGRRGK